MLKSEVIVEEKVDGSQFTFGLIDNELCCRSKGAEIYLEAPPKMFAPGVEAVVAIKDKLTPGYHYRGEYLSKPKHNCLAYDRIPKNYIVIFDIDDGLGNFLSPTEKKQEAERLGFECIPQLLQGIIANISEFQKLLQTISYLGGQQIEGVVIKPLNYNIFGPDKKVLMGKYVREEFRELNHKNFRSENPKQGDIIQILAQQLKTEARWHKAVQHLREANEIEDNPRDIGKLFKEVAKDLEKECTQEIKDQLYKWAWPSISRVATHGLAEWYKTLLYNRQFDEQRGYTNY